MKFNLKLLIITFVLSAGFAYAAEQKEDFENKDFSRFCIKKIREYLMEAEPGGWSLDAIDKHRVVEQNALGMIPFWYKEWNKQIATNLEESFFYLLDHPDYALNAFTPEFDQKIEELIKNKTDINNTQYTNGQTLMMKMLEKFSEIIRGRIKSLKCAENDSHLDLKNRFIAIAARYQEFLVKLIDVIKKVLPNVNDFYVKDDFGKTVFDYAKGNDEVTELLKSALKERKKKIGELLDIKTPLIPDLQDIVCDY